jgi:1-deoxy-D-xylulose-5-phosphate reductoisomerase
LAGNLAALAMKNIIVLGSTGSIGCSTLEVVSHHPGRFKVTGLAAHREVERLYQQVRNYRPAWVALADPAAADALAIKLRRLARPPRLLRGPEGVEWMARQAKAELAVAAIVGMAGLVSTIGALETGKDVALANKEVLVAAGGIIQRLLRRYRRKLLPVDSEHAALAQCMQGHSPQQVRRLILTASGGPFYNRSAEELGRVTPAEALKHPTWSMGAKISVDSATMMNKGLEVIEAHHLFGIPYERIVVMVHPQSIIHSMVEYNDGSCLAQLSQPDMRLPIQYALTAPERLAGPVRFLDLAARYSLTLEPPDLQRFSCLQLAYDAGRRGGLAPVILNAANEVAVEAFLQGRRSLTSIPQRIAAALRLAPSGKTAPDLSTILSWDKKIRAWARKDPPQALRKPAAKR